MEPDSPSENDEAVATVTSKALGLTAKTLSGTDGIKAYYFHSKFHLNQIKANEEMPALGDRLVRQPVKALSWSESGRGFIGPGKSACGSWLESIESGTDKLRSRYEGEPNGKTDSAKEDPSFDDASGEY